MGFEICGGATTAREGHWGHGKTGAWGDGGREGRRRRRRRLRALRVRVSLGVGGQRRHHGALDLVGSAPLLLVHKVMRLVVVEGTTSPLGRPEASSWGQGKPPGCYGGAPASVRAA